MARKTPLKANSNPQIVYQDDDLRYWVILEKPLNVPDYIKLKAQRRIKEVGKKMRFRLVIRRDKDQGLYSVVGEPNRVFKSRNTLLYAI